MLDRSWRQLLPSSVIVRLDAMLVLTCIVGSGCRMAGSSREYQTYEAPPGSTFDNDMNNGFSGVQQASATSSPRELCKVTLPRYVVEPPDILLIEAVNSLRVPKLRCVPARRCSCEWPTRSRSIRSTQMSRSSSR